MTSLKAYRHDLAQHLANGLGAAAAPLGAQVNPPAVIVRASPTYITASGYCTDALQFEALLIAPPGDKPAVADALDDLIDKVRPTLYHMSASGHRYGFREVTGFITYPSGDLELPAVVITVEINREYRNGSAA